MEPRITLVTLGVADLDRSLAFYRDGLGWAPSRASVEGDVAFFQLERDGRWRCGRGTQLAEDARLADGAGWGGIALAQNHGSREAVDAAVAAAVGGRRRRCSRRRSRPTGAGTRATSRTPTGIRGRSPTTRSGRSTRTGRLTLPA